MLQKETGGGVSPLAMAGGLLFLQTGISLLSSSFDGWGGYVFHLLSFILPIFLYIWYAKQAGIPICPPPTRAGFRRVLPLLPVFLFAVNITATATAYLLDLLDIPLQGGAVEGNGLFLDILSDCLVPSLIEEGLVRMAVLSLLLMWDSRHAIWVSAFIFALMHASLYQLPYALVGGFCLALATVWGGSPVYAFLFHFINNLYSLLLQYAARLWGETAAFVLSYVSWLVLLILSGISLFFVLRKRKRGEEEVQAVGTWRALVSSPLFIWMLVLGVFTVR